MAEYPYVLSISSLKPFFNHIQTAGVPTKVSQKYLSSVGFKSSGERPVIGVCKHLGFLDSSNAPTARWREYRNRTTSRTTMAQAIKESYSDLYETYPNAHSSDDNLLQDFISANSSLGSSTVGRAVRTFKTLCELATFDGDVSPSENPEGTSEVQEETVRLGRTALKPNGVGPNLHIDVQIHVDSTASLEQIDQIFASMARHLYQRNDS